MADSFSTETPEFVNISEKTLILFESKPRVYEKFDLFGAQINSTNDDVVLPLTQRYYINNLDPLASFANFVDVR